MLHFVADVELSVFFLHAAGYWCIHKALFIKIDCSRIDTKCTQTTSQCISSREISNHRWARCMKYSVPKKNSIVCRQIVFDWWPFYNAYNLCFGHCKSRFIALTAVPLPLAFLLHEAPLQAIAWLIARVFAILPIVLHRGLFACCAHKSSTDEPNSTECTLFDGHKSKIAAAN